MPTASSGSVNTLGAVATPQVVVVSAQYGINSNDESQTNVILQQVVDEFHGTMAKLLDEVGFVSNPGSFSMTVQFQGNAHPGDSPQALSSTLWRTAYAVGRNHPGVKISEVRVDTPKSH